MKEFKTFESFLNEGAGATKNYAMKNINVSFNDMVGGVLVDDKEIRVQYGMDKNSMKFPLPASIQNLTTTYQNIPKLEKEVWEAIVKEFEALDKKLPGIVEKVIKNYKP